MWAAISFDIDNTLVERDEAVRALLAPYLSAAALAVALELDAGRGTAALFRWLAERMPERGGAGDVARWFRGRLPALISRDPAVIEAVERIAARHRTVVVSNGGNRQRAKLAAAGLAEAFEHVLVSGEQGRRKPGPEIFERAAELLEVDRAAILHVGDDPVEDVAGASEAGLGTCWIARGRSFPAGLPTPTLSIEHVAQLPEVLAC